MKFRSSTTIVDAFEPGLVSDAAALAGGSTDSAGMVFDFVFDLLALVFALLMGTDFTVVSFLFLCLSVAVETSE